MNRILFAVAVFSVITASVVADARDKIAVKSEKEYMEMVCEQFSRPIILKAFEAKVLGMPPQDFSAWLMLQILRDKYLSKEFGREDLQTVEYLISGVYDGLWKTPSEGVANCKAGGKAFPNSERENLNVVQDHFRNQKKQASR